MKPRQLLAVLLFAALSCAAQTTTLYDNFNQRFLNQSLWFSVCGGFSVTEECATDIQVGHLHLARGLTGGTPVPLFDGRRRITSLIRKQDSRVAVIVEIAALSEWDRAADLP